ncbi:MAG: hypothetical protein JW750_07005 [Anaerolineaceae bacterium]|nr:hypothetical protein [Anaerolineaceae bacterium]
MDRQFIMPQKHIDLAKQYLMKHGREIDQVYFQFAIEDGDEESVVDALSAYQNPDGGFGLRLETDIGMPDSSVLATTVAFQMIWHLGLNATHPMVRAGIDYFLSTLERETLHWYSVPKEVELHPRAPWWQFHPEPEAHYHNPTPEVVGYLCEYQDLVDEALLARLCDMTLKRFLEHLEQIEMHELFCYQRLLNCRGVPITLRNALSLHLPKVIDRIVEHNREKWGGYCLEPIKVVSSLNEPWVETLDDVLYDSLEYTLAMQNEDGSWDVKWSWSDEFPEAAKRSQIESKSLVTRENVIKLSYLSHNP